MPLFSIPSLAILAACAAGWSVFWLLSLRRAPKSAQAYRPAPATITACWKDEVDEPGSPPPGDYWVKFEFEWDGRMLEGDDVADESDNLGAIATGAKATVWVPPNKPKNAALHDPKSPPPSGMPLRALAFLAIASWLALLGILTVLGYGG